MTATINDRLTAIGSGVAIQSVVVMPQATGTIDEILVRAGQKVTKGQVLARLDDDEQLIERDKAQVALRSAVEKAASYKNLQSVTRLDALDAQIAEEAAKLALSTAQLNLKRREITAPIDGVAGIVPANVGDNVTTQTSIVTLDDLRAQPGTIERMKREFLAVSASTDFTTVSIDLDVVNASAGPGVSAPPADGLSAEELVRFSDVIGRSSKVQMLDLMEHAPPFDENAKTARLAALCLWRFLAGVAAR